MSEVEYAPTLAQKIGAEVLGTFVLVFFGVGAAIVSGGDYVATGLSFGIAVLVMAYAVGHISGGHFNPAVSLGAALGGRVSWAHAGIYAAAQVGAAILAALALFVMMKGIDGFEAEGNMGANGFGDAGNGYALWGALVVEVIATAVFLYIILAATDSRNPSASAAPVAIGLALTGIHFATMGFTGTSVNPARSIGPALFSGGDAIAQLWLFIVAPLLGAAVAGLTYGLVFGRGAEPVEGSGLAAFSGGKQPGVQSGAWNQQEGWGGTPAGQGWGAGAPQQGWAAGAPQASPPPVAQSQYPGWQWDAQAQQWVPDPSTAQQHQPGAGDESRTQIRPGDET